MCKLLRTSFNMKSTVVFNRQGNPSHLVVVGAAVLGYGTLTVHQEAVPPPLLRQSVLVALSDVAVQLALLVADGLHVLERGRKRMA